MIVGSLNETGRAPSKFISSRETQITADPAKESALLWLFADSGRQRHR
jgi:hypothetical protein